MKSPAKSADARDAGPGDYLNKVYDELRVLAASRMLGESETQTLQPTALVHEAWLRIGGSEGKWDNTGHFFAAAGQAMRRILIERARYNSRMKRGRGWSRLELENLDLAMATVDDRVILISEALDQLNLIDPLKAEIVNLKFFAGLTNAEVGRILDVSEKTVGRHWLFAKTWLYTAIERQIGGEKHG